MHQLGGSECLWQVICLVAHYHKQQKDSKPQLQTLWKGQREAREIRHWSAKHSFTSLFIYSSDDNFRNLSHRICPLGGSSPPSPPSQALTDAICVFRRLKQGIAVDCREVGVCWRRYWETTFPFSIWKIWKMGKGIVDYSVCWRRYWETQQVSTRAQDALAQYQRVTYTLYITQTGTQRSVRRKYSPTLQELDGNLSQHRPHPLLLHIDMLGRASIYYNI